MVRFFFLLLSNDYFSSRSIYELTGLALKLHEIELELTSLNEIKTKCMIGKFSPDNVKPLGKIMLSKHLQQCH